MYRHFDDVMRMELSILRKKGYSVRTVADALKVNHSSVVRELRRNRRRNGLYDPKLAEQKSYIRRKYSKFHGMKIRNEPWLEDHVKEKLMIGWTPEEIAKRLEKEEGKTIISTKSIYRWLTSVYGLAYRKYMPYKLSRWKYRRKEKKGTPLPPDRTFINDRPPMINERKRNGDFEGDVLGFPKGSFFHLAGMADRRSRYFVARRVHGLRNAMEQGYFRMKEENAACSVTLDNGPENARFASLGIPVYFCNTYHPWEKGTIENTFQRLRRWIPKRVRIDDYTDDEIAIIVERMNNTPRKCLDFKTPAEVFKEHR